MDPLADLKDIHLPDPVSMWPLALGWWLLLALALVVVLLLVWAYRRYQSQAARRLAMSALKEADSPQQIMVILKSLCLNYFSREQVAGLYGEPLKHFLSQHLTARHRPEFEKLSAGLFSQVHARNRPTDFTDKLKIAVDYWIQHALFTRVKQEARP